MRYSIVDSQLLAHDRSMTPKPQRREIANLLSFTEAGSTSDTGRAQRAPSVLVAPM